MPSSLGILIGYNVGSCVMFEATLERLQALKKNPRPTLSQEIEQLTRENGYLRQELTYHHKMQTWPYTCHGTKLQDVRGFEVNGEEG